MVQISAQLIRDVCRSQGATPSEQYVTAFSSAEANALYVAYGIDDPRDLAAFFAMISQETGGMRLVRENMKYSARNLMNTFGKRYKGKPDSDRDGLSDLAEAHAGKPILVGNYNYGFRLSNEKNGLNDDDGYNFRGGGPFQATGRAMYLWLQRETGLPFHDQPKTIEEPEHWPLVAVLTWTKQPIGNLSNFASQGNFDACCKAINCGSPYSTTPVNGMTERKKWYQAWLKALEVQPKAGRPGDVTTFRLGAPKHEAVKVLQGRLNALMYKEGRLDADGDYGARTASAVRDFQAQNGMSVDGVATPEVQRRIMSAEAIPWPPPRAALGTAADRRRAGDPAQRSADQQIVAAGTLGVVGVAGGLAQSGVLEMMAHVGSVASTFTSAVMGITGAIKFGMANLLWCVCIVGAIWCFVQYRRTAWEAAGRWRAHLRGWRQRRGIAWIS
jgi:predicted chitinase